MKFHSFLTFAILVISMVSNGYSQDSATPKLKHSIGLGAGFATGYGLSYRYMPKKFGFQVNFAPFKNSSTTRISTGITFSYDLKIYKSSRLYLYQANHYYYNKEKTTNVDFNNIPYSSQILESYVNNGLGFGLELTILERLGLNFMTGYAFYENFNGVNVTGEAAIYYKF